MNGVVEGIVATDAKVTGIRRYELDDIPIIVDAVMKYVPELPNYKGIKVDAGRVKFLLTTSARDESAFMVRLLVNQYNVPVGGVAGYCVTQLLSYDKMTNDVFLFILPEYRSLYNVVSLINAYKTWGRERNAAIIAATQTGGYKPEQIGRLLEEHCGFELVGSIYYLRS